MTPDIAPEVFEPEMISPSTAGMTTKVVKGSLWTLGGQILPMAVSLIATPFTIRLLGSEAYGMVILVGLIPTYFAFADFGMGIASTKFGSEAYSESDSRKEGEIVRTAATIAFFSSLVIAVPIFLFSAWIIRQFSIPAYLQPIGSSALKITAVAFVLTVLSTVFNTPMLARLRMDLNSITGTVPKVIIGVMTPIILYLGGGILGAIWMAFIAGLIGCGLVLYFSGKLLPGLLNPTINKAYFRPLLKFGGAWVVAMVAVTLLVNVEKLLLARLVSVKALAYYSVAFTFANLAITFALALLQSLIPAFSQLQLPELRAQLNNLFARANRLMVLGLIPTLGLMAVIGKPFITLWAGSEFGLGSSSPFYVLLIGIALVLLASVSNCAVLSAGKTNLLAKIYWTELFVYTVSAFILIYFLGVLGAALAWSIRSLFDFLLIVNAMKRHAVVEFSFYRHVMIFAMGAAILLPQVVFAIAIDNYSLWLIPIIAISNILYSIYAWHVLVDEGEKKWIRQRLGKLPNLNIS